jgi:hypothetical protein
MSEKAMAAAMANPAIIRNRLKIRAAVKNARAFLACRKPMAASMRSSGLHRGSGDPEPLGNPRSGTGQNGFVRHRQQGT